MDQEQTDEIKALNQDLIMSQPVLQKNFNIPVHVTDLSAFDDSFSFLKARFQAEMDRVTNEMNKFRYRKKLDKRSQAGPRIKSASSRASEPSTTPSENKDQVIPPGLKKGMPAQETWAAISESPLIMQEGDSKKLKLQFDVSQFDSAEVNVQFLDDIIYVKAKHDERTESSLVLREYNQQFMLPRGVDPEAVVTSLSRDGVLTVEVPLPPIIMELVKEGTSYKKPKAPFPKKKSNANESESELEEASTPAQNPPANSPAIHPINPPAYPLINPPSNAEANPPARASARPNKRSS